MRIEDTSGKVTYLITNCDCGLTGGCDKCQPIYFPETHEEDFLAPDLEEYYRKKGYFEL